jgi:hypothetical protein
MTLRSTPTAPPGVRRLRSVPWCHDGRESLVATVDGEIPSCDDGMIRSALVRGADASQTTDALTRVLNRELWAIGYVARLEPDLFEQSGLLVRIESGR